MKRNTITCIALALNFLTPAFGMNGDTLRISHLADEENLVRLEVAGKYLLLPVQDDAQEARLGIIKDNLQTGVGSGVRLARERVDYYVPFEISQYSGEHVTIDIQGVPGKAICWERLEVSDRFDTANREKFRPQYHHTPVYGWMNDPNGMFFKDGVYHLYFQHNPYGSKWGNLSWRHSTSTDLINWKDEGVAIAPDAIGMIFSGSCVVDHDNTSGFGKDAIVAFYTSAKQASRGDRQTQSMAYSLDGGKTFVKYRDNPILTSKEKNFRDPKVFWYAPKGHWVMVLAVDRHMEIYSSENLRDWKKESDFGEGHGCHDGVWECPDLVELPVEGTKDRKWVLICNINPGGPFGGSAAQYFVGDFDGSTFSDNYPGEVKWMDYGKDNYATVTWNNAPDGRCMAIGWMNNWQYADCTPTKQYRSANTIARDLSLFRRDGKVLLKSEPCREMAAARKDARQVGSANVTGTETIPLSPQSENGAYEIELTLNPGKSRNVTFSLANGNGDRVLMTYDTVRKTFAMDRTKSGEVSFSYAFPTVTEMPVGSKSGELHLRLFVDRSSVEVFAGNGEYVMTNCVYPSEPYDTITFESDGNRYEVKNMNIYKIK